MHSNHNDQIAFLSLGLVVLDEIRLLGQEPLTNVLGGSSAYGSLFMYLPHFLRSTSNTVHPY
jgi:hypothetical protein